MYAWYSVYSICFPNNVLKMATFYEKKNVKNFTLTHTAKKYEAQPLKMKYENYGIFTKNDYVCNNDCLP